MKKITTNGEDINLRIDGTTVLSITKKGIVVADEHAAIAVDRLGGTITVTTVDIEKVAKEILAEEPNVAPPIGEPVVEETPEVEEPVVEETPAEEPVVEEAPVESAPKAPKAPKTPKNK